MEFAGVRHKEEACRPVHLDSCDEGRADADGLIPPDLYKHMLVLKVLYATSNFADVMQ